MIISISGKKNSGKDTVGRIIQILIAFPKTSTQNILRYLENWEEEEYIIIDNTSWEIKKFADILKDIVCILLGCTREQLEDREFKEKELGEEWWYYKDSLFTERMLPYTDNKELEDDLTYYIIKLTPRLLLQLLGTECGRQIIHPNIWVNALMSEYNCVPADLAPGGIDCPNWIITDMRFPNELKAVEEKGGITIRVNRDKCPNCSYGKLMSTRDKKRHCVTCYYETEEEHESETALDDAEFDYVIQNDGTLEELLDKVREIYNKIKI